jgi:hypothetical protein
MLDAASGVRPGAAAIHFVIQRTATDLPPGLGGNLRIAEGKAEFYCRTQRIYVWSMGMEMASGLDVPPHVGWSCPKPADWSVQSRGRIRLHENLARPEWNVVLRGDPGDRAARRRLRPSRRRQDGAVRRRSEIRSATLRQRLS